MPAPTAPPIADNNAAAAPSNPIGQAPDEVIKKLSALIHAEKYDEANKLVSGLSIAYPDDARLTKAKGLLEKLVTAPKAAEVPAVNNAPAASATPPAVKTDSAQLTGMDKVEYNSLLELGREAQQSTDLDEQKKLLKQFIEQSRPFLSKHPDELLLWQLQAASALSLGDPLTGYEAGQKLFSVIGTGSESPNLMQLVTKINIKGWLDKDRVLVKANDWNIRFKDWYQFVLAFRAKREWMDAATLEITDLEFHKPEILLSYLAIYHLLETKSNQADVAAATTGVEAEFERLKVDWIKRFGTNSDFSKYPQAFGMTMDEYRKWKIWATTALKTRQRTKPDIKKLEKEAGVQILDVDLKRILIVTNSVSQAGRTYTIIAGDTLAKIANKNQVSINSLRAANPDVSFAVLTVGQVVNLPPPEAKRRMF